MEKLCSRTPLNPHHFLLAGTRLLKNPAVHMKKAVLFRAVWLKVFLLTLILGGLLGSLTLTLLYRGVIWFNNPSFSRYPVQGLDVSHHQSYIDWNKVAEKTKYSFAFIKATEGGDWKDTRFQENWRNSRKAGILRGAYHFFTFCRTGKLQAQNFIDSVPVESGTLPPVIDLEFGGNCRARPTREKLLAELEFFIQRLEKVYGQKPLLYITYDFQERYLKENLPPQIKSAPLWIRDIFKSPWMPENREWLFWQYSNRGHVPGIKGFVDLNVFKGKPADLEKLLTR